ncbi:MAG: hypothetical protein RIQ92_806 [Actinomycetota bacterium]|jgi:hypothetical protein
MKKLATLISFILFFIVLHSIVPVNASNTRGEVKAPCRLEVDYAHISKGKLKIEGTKFVKVKARSVCTIHQSQVTITLKIMKLGQFYDHEVMTFKTDPLSRTSSGLRVEMNNAFVRCKDSRKTYYFGIATSKALVGGQWVYAGATYSINPKLLDCGT